MKNVSPALQNSADSDGVKLKDVVFLSRQFQRSVRLDIDFGDVAALRGYICQGTARSVLESTARHIEESSQRAFTWTGPFGGGKSSLAVALCSLVSDDPNTRQAALEILSLDGEDDSYIPRAFSATGDGWLVMPVVGNRSSVVDALVECLDKKAGTLIASKTKSGSRQRISRLLTALSDQAEQREKNGVLLVIDELGKFLEASAGDGDDVYFYQELAELAARAKGKIVVVGVLHQSFEQYASRLGTETRDDWRKIQGRYVDIPLVAASDEVVELVGRAIESDFLHPESWEICNQVSQSIRHNRPSLTQNFASRLDLCWPLHPVTATLLGPISKRRFGQNERSTFGFLASAESRSLKEFLELTSAHENKTYAPSDFFDYLRSNFEPSILSSPDGHRWSQSVEAVERVGHKKVEGDLHLRLIKTIALIDMFRSNSGLIADERTLAASLVIAQGRPSSIVQVQELLQDLRRWAVIIYKRHIGSWSIAEGSDFDLDEVLSQTLSTIDEPDLSQIAKLVHLSPVLAKRHYCETGTLRWMVPIMSHFHQVLHSVTQASTLLEDQVSSSAFGVFLLVLPARGHSVPQTIKAIRKDASISDLHLPILIGVPRNGESIREFGRELVAYDQIRTSRSELENDAVARRELHARIAEVKSRLEEEVRDALTNIQWVNLDHLPLNVDYAKPGPVSLPQLASMLADRRFSSGPLIFSELVNRDSLSSNSAKARKELLYAMLRSGSEERLGFEGFPAEAGLYHNILEASGLHQKTSLPRQADGRGGYEFSDPSEASLNFPRSKSFVQLWSSAINLVVGSTRPIPLLELYALWQAPPFGVRAGVLPIIWLAFSLANQRRIAIYKDGMFIAELREVDVDEAIRDPSRFELRYVQIDEHKREILDGIASHLRHIGQEIGTEPLEAARGLVALVYGLPLWSRRTHLLSERTRAVRDALLRASDPHRVLFVDLPTLFADLSVGQYIDALGLALDELRAAYAGMLTRVIGRTLETLDASLDSEESCEALRMRSRSVAGIAGDFQIDAFASRLSTLTTNMDSIEGLLSLAVHKPPREWTDRDIDTALIQLAQWSLQFRRVEAVSDVQDRKPTRNAIAVVFGTGQQGRTVSEMFDISPAEEKIVQALSEKIAKEFKNVKREIFLAALAQAGTKLVGAENLDKESTL